MPEAGGAQIRAFPGNVAINNSGATAVAMSLTLPPGVTRGTNIVRFSEGNIITRFGEDALGDGTGPIFGADLRSINLNDEGEVAFLVNL